MAQLSTPQQWMLTTASLTNTAKVASTFIPTPLHLKSQKWSSPNIDPQDIATELNNNFKVVKCTKMRQKAPEPHPHPLYLLQVDAETKLNDLYKINYIQDARVKIQKYYKRDGTTQCYNCQEYGHGTQHCFKLPRCVNCQGEHPANYRGCPVYMEFMERRNNSKQGRSDNDTGTLKTNSLPIKNTTKTIPNANGKSKLSEPVDITKMHFPPLPKSNAWINPPLN